MKGTGLGRQTFALGGEGGGESAAHLRQPADDTAALLRVVEMLAADGVRLGAETDVPAGRQGMLRMFERLAEGRSAVSATIESRPYVEMGVDVNDSEEGATATWPRKQP